MAFSMDEKLSSRIVISPASLATSVPLHMSQLQGLSTLQAVRELYRAHYDGSEAVSVADSVPGLITALFDNLGKGASGAAAQNMNLMLGFPETAGLNLD